MICLTGVIRTILVKTLVLNHNLKLSPFEFLPSPAVGSVSRVGRGPGAVPAQVDIRLAAVLHRAPVLGLVHQAGHVRHAHLGCKLVDRGGVPSLAGPSGATVDDGLRGEGEVGEPVLSRDLKSEVREIVILTVKSQERCHLSARAERVPWAQQDPLGDNSEV